MLHITVTSWNWLKSRLKTGFWLITLHSEMADELSLARKYPPNTGGLTQQQRYFMADENEQKTNSTVSEEDIPEEIRGKVLVAKVGQEDLFLEQLAQAHKIAHGALGWQGQAEIMYEIGAYEAITGKALDPSLTKEEGIAVVKDLIQQAHLQSIIEHAEWVTPEEADKRRKAQEVLFSHKDHGNGD